MTQLSSWERTLIYVSQNFILNFLKIKTYYTQMGPYLIFGHFSFYGKGFSCNIYYKKTTPQSSLG